MNSIKYPSYWRKVRLKDVCESTNQKTNDSRLPYIGLENIEGFSGRLISQFNNEDDSIIECTSNEFQEGDVLFGKLRPYLAKCWLATFRGRCSLELLVLRAKGANNRFLKYLLLSPSYLNTINNSTYGTKMPRANWSFIGNILSFLPPIEEQNVIAEYLDRETARIDGIVERLRAQSERYEQLKRSLITETITQGLPHHDPSTFRSLRLKAVCSINPNYSEELTDDEEVSFLSMENIKQGYFINDQNRLLSEVKGKYTYCADGDIVMAKITPSFENGNIALLKELTNRVGFGSSELITFRPSILANPHFLLYFLQNETFKNGVASTIKGVGGLRRIDMDDLKVFMIALPTLEIQSEIVSYLDERCSKINQLSEKISRKIELLEQLKKSLIEEVVTGQRPVKIK